VLFRLKALSAACAAKDGAGDPFGTDGADDTGLSGGRGAAPGGRGGAAAGSDGGTTEPDTFLDDGGGKGGFFPIGGAGFGFPGVEFIEDMDDTDDRKLFLNEATEGP
jgi:hypothetical protein